MTPGILATITAGDMDATIAVPVWTLWLLVPLMLSAAVTFGMLVEDVWLTIRRAIRKARRRRGTL